MLLLLVHDSAPSSLPLQVRWCQNNDTVGGGEDGQGEQVPMVMILIMAMNDHDEEAHFGGSDS